MKVKGWQVAVILLGLIVGGGLFYRSISSGEVDLNSTIYLVDVESGALYKYAVVAGKSLVLPARRPDTMKIALVRIVKSKQDGSWVVSSNDLGLLDALDSDIQVKAIDAESGKLLVPAASPSRYTPPIPKS